MLTRTELDRKVEPKTRVIVRMTFPDVKTYRVHEDEVKHLAEVVGASLAVKMG